MTTAENLNRIIQAKNDIKQAIENKGVTVGDMTIDKYAEKIDEISGKWIMPKGINFAGSTFYEFDGGQLDTTNLTNMSTMFSNCDALISFKAANWDTSNVLGMSYLFSSCYNLTSIDVAGWDTSKVTNMSNMFYKCSGLTSIDLSSWDMSNVTDMDYMFAYCENLREIRMGGDVSNVIDMEYMFFNLPMSGTFYYNPAYDYSKIIEQLPKTWTAVPME